jgi:type I restriction enzyme, S subunit
MAKTNPEVRFAGFSENWAEGELSKILTERKVMQKITEDAPILAFAAGQGVIDRSERKSNNRDHLTHDQENKIYKLTELNDIVYNPSNLKYGAIDRNKHGRGVISPIYVTFTAEEEPSFVELIVKSENFKLKALQYEEGTVVKRQSVKPENLLSLKVNISPSKDEQKRIGTFFEQLDMLIKLHQHKHEKLVIIKKGLLDKMFPKAGGAVPEIRFLGFLGAWKEYKLAEHSAIITGGTPSTAIPEYWKPKQVPWMSSGEINKKRIYNTDNKISENGLNNSSAKWIKENSVLIALAGQGKTRGTVAINHVPLTTNQSIAAIIPNSNIHYEYLFQNLENRYEELRIKSSGDGTRGGLNKQIISEIEIFCPNIDEQKKIGSIFIEIDSLIKLHDNQLRKLANIKKACFEKMTNTTSKHFA